MIKRLKGLLALCLAGILLFSMMPKTVSAAANSKIVALESIPSEGTHLYPNDIIASAANGSGRTFAVVQYEAMDQISDATRKAELESLKTNGFLTEEEWNNLKGVYRYWDLDWNSYAVFLKRHVDGSDLYWSADQTEITEDDKQLFSKDYFYEYYPLDYGYQNNPERTAFGYHKTRVDNNITDYFTRALKLPSAEKLFGPGYEGYHYLVQPLQTYIWESSYDNTPTGIVPMQFGFSRPITRSKDAVIDKIFGYNEQSGSNLPCPYYILLTPVPNEYTVSYDPNGGTGTMEDQTLTYGSGALNPNTFTNPDHSFVGWNTKADGTGVSYCDQQTVPNVTVEGNATVTLYAQWKEENYTIHFDTDGGSTIANKSVHWSDKALEGTKTPTKDGYTFTGWTHGNTKVTSDTAYSELAQDKSVKEITLKAQYEQIKVPEVKPEEPAKPAKTATLVKPAVPPTGDSGSILLLTSLVLLSSCSITGLKRYRRKRFR